MLEYLDVIVQKARLQQAILPRYLINNCFSESELKVCSYPIRHKNQNASA